MLKQQQMQNNLEETQKLKELVEIEMTRVALQNELNMNRKYGANVQVRSPSLPQPLNLDREMTQKVGAANLKKMHKV